ncbi:hypothetical protein [Chitinophaga barathri]|uniref:Glyoxalase n=1 Tax=Chitinophaga barathri TaxID=1647451 RepID=A0A3N4MKG1_9BACT|nr:hypothetical protein [Chitinophaga barathri]RPD40069.1 hypothetical protein EG028_15545 [Chitinophaga barathri]
MSPKEWMTVPVLPCIELEDTLTFWELLGFTTTYKQLRPYQYGAVARNGYELHFVRVKGIGPANNYSGCLVMVSDAEKVHREFTRQFKKGYGKIPNAGTPRISRMKPGQTRFTLTDVSGNSIIFISYGEKDQEVYEKADDPHLTPLQKSMVIAIRFSDYKNDYTAAAKTLDVALKRDGNEAKTDIAEALLMRLDLARERKELKREKECKVGLMSLMLSVDELSLLKQKLNPHYWKILEGLL